MQNDRTRQIEVEMRKLFRDSPPGPFRPFAVFEERLDRIVVLTRDCSVTETRVNDVLVMLENNYPGDGEERYVGFVIEGARGFLAACGFSADEPPRLQTILNVLAGLPGSADHRDTLAHLLTEHRLDTIELSNEA